MTRGEWALAAALVVWLFALNFPPMLLAEGMEVAQIVSLAWITPLFLLAGTNRFVLAPALRESPAVRVSTAVFLIVVVASSALSLDPELSFGYAASTVLGLWICAGLHSCLRRGLERSLILYSAVWSSFAVLVYLEGMRVQGRLNFGVGHPNFLAVVSFGGLACSLAIPSRFARAALVAFNFLIIIETQARSCLIAAVITIVVYAVLRMLFVKDKAGFPVLETVSAAVLIAAAVAIYWRETVETVSTLLFLQDRFRGVGSGFTGRTDAWQEAYQLFLANPIFGVGFRVHNQYMSGLIKSAHNGYLSMLADSGIMGLLSAMALLAVCSWRLLGKARTGDRVAIVGFSFVIGYLFVAIFERYLINFGSSTSVLMWIFLSMPGRRNSAMPRSEDSIAPPLAA